LKHVDGDGDFDHEESDRPRQDTGRNDPRRGAGRRVSGFQQKIQPGPDSMAAD
jgi:hypothetical protein